MEIFWAVDSSHSSARLIDRSRFYFWISGPERATKAGYDTDGYILVGMRVKRGQFASSDLGTRSGRRSGKSDRAMSNDGFMGEWLYGRMALRNLAKWATIY